MREPLIWHLHLRSVASLGKADALAGVIIWSECCCVARTWPANSPLVPHFAGPPQPIVPGWTVPLPGEIFVELGLAIKQDSPFPSTIITELANGSIGYIPTRRAYSQGNYEVVSARCAEGSGELLVDSAIRLLKELHSVQNGASTAASR